MATHWQTSSQTNQDNFTEFATIQPSQEIILVAGFCYLIFRAYVIGQIRQSLSDYSDDEDEVPGLTSSSDDSDGESSSSSSDKKVGYLLCFFFFFLFCLQNFFCIFVVHNL